MPYLLSVGSEEKRAVRAFWLRIEKKICFGNLKAVLSLFKMLRTKFLLEDAKSKDAR